MNTMIKATMAITAVSVMAATGFVLTSNAARRTAKQVASAVENTGHKMGKMIDRMH